MREELIQSLKQQQSMFNIELSHEAIERLADFYELILESNPLLHLVGPCSPTEFATRHILESLTMLKHLPQGARFADIGSGGGLPAIPCLIVRDDISAVLIESKEKKADFLRLVSERLGLAARCEIVGQQFSEVLRPDASYTSCRALDKFIDKVPKIIKWSGPSKLLLFGGPTLRDALTSNQIRFGEELMPLSEQRFLFFTR